MIYEKDIQEKLNALLRRDMSLGVFERWLGSNSWSMFKDGSESDVIHLVAAVNLLISELHDHVIDERGFRSELEAVICFPVDSQHPKAPAWRVLKAKPREAREDA